MIYLPDKLHLLTDTKKYPRCAKYDPVWIVENQLGSHCLWLLEALTNTMKLTPGMRVLDLGCGKAIGSVFLAKEVGVQVFAVDLKVSASDNWKRICAAGVDHLVTPLQLNALSLPFADGFFDAVISVNSLQYYGTEDLYFKNHLCKLVKPGGEIGAIVPGLYREFCRNLPDYLAPHWRPDYYNWHTAEWWRWHLEKNACADIELADTLDDGEGARIWRVFGEVTDPPDDLIIADEGRNITFVRLLTRRK